MAKLPQFPYADRYTVLRGLPSEGRDHATVLAELREMATEEDRAWEHGKASGSFYCGDHEHYRFMAEAFGLYGHVNALQRDIAPSATRFEGEIIAMGLDLMHAEAAAERGHEPVGLVTSGGSGSIAHAMLAYREQGYSNGIRTPNVVKAETAHPAFDKACHLFGIEIRKAPIDPVTTQVDVDAMAAMVDGHTIALVASAGNYGYGTIDPIDRLSEVAVARGIGLHVDGCLGGFILPFGEQLGYEIAPFDFRLPGVTTISADTHKYGYGFKGTSILMFRDKALRNGQYFFMTDWSGGRYTSPGMDGSRSSGLLAATWASMVVHGRSGYLEKAKRIFQTAFAMQEEVRSHSSLMLMGRPTFCFSFRSDDYDVYHVNDFMRTRGWRLNGQQRPNALHMAVTGPQTQPGVVEAWATDLADAVVYAQEHREERPRSAAVYAGDGASAGDAEQAMRAAMTAMLDRYQSVPPRE
jgi:glutamate/tyrosine decarboxylase-like PLP-dependent enzyme